MYITQDLFTQHDVPTSSHPRPTKLVRAKTYPEPSPETLGKRKWSSIPVEEPLPKRASVSLPTPKTSPPTPRKLLDPRPRRRAALAENATTTNWAVTPTKFPRTAPVLQPCHICHKAPKQKGDLDAYTNCQRCHARTCYICVRQCELHSTEATICSSCCVERGEDGATSCLDCLALEHQDHDMAD